MNTNTKNKLVTILIAVLLIANITTLVFFWINFNGNHPPKNDRKPVDFIIKQLNFTKEQQEKFNALVQEHRSESRQLKKAIKEANEKLFELLKSDSLSDTESKVRLENLAQLQAKLSASILQHFYKVRKLCSETQKKEFDEIVNEVTARVSQDRERNPPPRDRNHPPRNDRDNDKDQLEPPPPPNGDFHHGPPPDDNFPPPPNGEMPK